MKLTKYQLQEIIYRTLHLINEGMSKQQLDKLFLNLSNNPHWSEKSKQKIIVAFNSGINKLPQIEWLANFYILFPNNIEPISEVIKTMKDFNRLNATIRGLGLESDMTKYESPSDLRSSIMRSQGKVSKADLTKEATHLGKFGAYNLYMPHSKEASCTLGEDTTWCTAVTGKGNNLFYNYVAKKNAADTYGGNVYLFYLIADESDESTSTIPNEYKKMSLGYVNGEVKFAESHDQGGGLTVTAKNNGLTEREASNWLGSEIWDAEEEIDKHIKKIEGSGKEHPAREKFKELANNPALLKRELQGSSLDTKEDTLEMVREIHKPNPPSDEEIARIDQRSEFIYWGDLPEYMPQYPPEIKEIIFKEVQKIFYRRIAYLAKRVDEISGMYTINLVDFMASVEHPEGDMFEDRHASIKIYSEIRKQELGEKKKEILMFEEYFSIIRKAGLELINTQTKNIVQPKDVSDDGSDGIHTSYVSIIKKDSISLKTRAHPAYFMD